MYYWFIFNHHDLLLQRTAEGGYTVPTGEECPINLNDGDETLDVSPSLNGCKVKTVDTKATGVTVTRCATFGPHITSSTKRCI